MQKFYKKIQKLSLLIVLLSFLCLGVAAQNKAQIDSLNRALAQSAEDSNRVYILCELTAQYATLDKEKALGYAQEALRVSKHLQNVYAEGYALNMIGYVYDFQSEFDKATEYYLKSLKIKESIQDLSGIAASYQNLGVVAYFQGENTQALDYYQKARALREQLQDQEGIAAVLNNLGMLYRKEARYEEALAVYKQALRIKKELGRPPASLAATLHNIGITYQYQKDYRTARKYLEESLFFEQKAGHCYGIVGSWTALGELALVEGAIEDAQALLYKALEKATDCSAKDFELQVYQLLVQADTLTQNYRAALAHQQRYQSIKDEIYSKEKAEAIAKYQSLYETEKKERENQVQQEENRALRQKLYSGALIALLLLLLLALLYWQTRTLGQKRQLALQKAQAEQKQMAAEKRADEEEKMRLAEEMRAQQEIVALQEAQWQALIDHKNRELSSFSLHMIEKNEIFSTLKEQLERLQTLAPQEELLAKRLKELLKLVKQHTQATEEWERFKHYFEEVHPDFFKKLQEKTEEELSAKELKLCAYLKLHLDTKSIANLLDMSVRSVESYKYRIKKKLALEEAAALQEYLLLV